MTNIILPFQPGTIKPEADYLELRRLSAKLGIPCPETFIKLESVGPDGKLVSQYSDRSRTLNRNYWNWLFKLFAAHAAQLGSSGGSNAFASDSTFGAAHLTNKNTAGTVLNMTSSGFGNGPGVVASSSQLLGIVVGTGTAAESFEDFALGSVCGNGTGLNQFSYTSMSQQEPSYSAGTLTWTATVVRILNNNSASTIAVGETGIYATQPTVSTTTGYMIMRDLLGATVNVLSGGQLTVTYTFTLVFPA